MKLCGKYSLSEAALVIAITDMIFSVLCMIIHSAEVFTSSPSVKMRQTQLDNYLMITGNTLVLWIYIVLNSLNLFSGVTLVFGALRKDYVKCTVYLMIWSISIILGIATYIFHVSSIRTSTLYFGLIIYPIFYTYKIFSLWVVKCFMDEFKNEAQVKIPLLIRRSVKHSRRRKKQDFNKQSKGKRYLLNTTLAQLKENAFQISGSILHIDFGHLLAYDEKTAVMTAKLDLENGQILDVAVKTTKSNANFETSCSLLLEMKLLANLECHDNVLQFLGACCDYPGHEGKTFLVTEIYSPTTLYEFLVDSQNEYYGSFDNQIKDDTIIPAPFKDQLYENVILSIRANFCTTSLVVWAHQISDGMEYLHTKKIVHGFLCTKNLLLFDNGLCKISGFRFAAQLFNNKYSCNKVDITGSYPWRWMSVECIESKEDENFTEKSDVWSYGVTLWEMFSLGQCPYADWDKDFVQELLIGTRLGKPRFSTTEIYTIMAACWNRECGERPSFYVLKLFFKQILNSLNLQRRNIMQTEDTEEQQ